MNTYDTLTLPASTKFPAIARTSLETLQVNLGYRCNQRCLHCHVNAGHTRTEVMDNDILDLVLEVVEELILRFRGRYTVVIFPHNLAQARRVANYAAFFWIGRAGR